MNPIAKCASCGANSKVGTTFNRHSPNTSLVNAHFHGAFESANDIQLEGVLCYSCYKVHLIIVKNHDKQVIGSNQQLQEDIMIWRDVYNSKWERLHFSTTFFSMHTSYVA